VNPGAALAWARQRSAAEWVALAAGLAVFGYVGWDLALWDARLQLLLHLLAIGAIGGLLAIALRGGEVPATRVDLPVLGLLAAFALATVFALNVGMSLRAMGSILATASMLPVALVALRHRPAWVGSVTAVPILLLSIPTLGVLLARRIEWVLVGAPGLPPIRLVGEGTPFGSVAVPPFVIWPAWALAGLIEPAGARRAVRAGLVLVGVPLTILSGSRSAWAALAVVGVAVGLPWAWRRRRGLLAATVGARRLVVAIAALAALGLAAAVVAPRLTAITSIVYRADLWRDTLRAWSTDPAFGIGPGFMPYAREAFAADFSFPVRQPHSHNLALGVLGDAGLVGLAAGVVAVVALLRAAGPWRSTTPVGRVAAVTLLGLGVAGLFEDLTFLPNFNLLAIVLIAVALLDAGAVRWVRPAAWPRLHRAAALAAGGLVSLTLLVAMIIADAGAIAYRSGIEAAEEERWVEATAHLQRSVAVDPWHPAGPKALVVAADAAGRTSLARAAAERATSLNPGDARSWTNLALLCAREEDPGCAQRAAERAVATARFGGAELLNAALLYEALGDTGAADDAYRRSLLSQQLTALAVEWPRRVRIGADAPAGMSGAHVERPRVIAWWATGEPIDASAIDDPAVRAFAHAMRGETAAASEWVERAIARQPDLPATWEIAVLVRDWLGESVEHEIAVARAVRGGPLPTRDDDTSIPPLGRDIASFRFHVRDELVWDATRLILPEPYPWSLGRVLP
jgi:tetratricopeptide (TPR) repeat protein